MAISRILFCGSPNAHNDRVRRSNPLRFDCSRQQDERQAELGAHNPGQEAPDRVGLPAGCLHDGRDSRALFPMEHREHNVENDQARHRGVEEGI